MTIEAANEILTAAAVVIAVGWGISQVRKIL